METKENHKFYTQLEGLRGIAVLMVLTSHFIIMKNFPGLKFLELGFWGVNIFFVLSGFLITEILLKEIYANNSAKDILRRFYLKRTLRIFPIYYLIIILLAIFKVGGTESALKWSLTYTLNIQEIWFGGIPNVIFHFWSLCVEEQFYIIWPFLLLLVPSFFHKRIILFILFGAALLRFCFAYWQVKNYISFNHDSMFTCMDALGTGALLAYLKLNEPERLKKILERFWVPLLLISSFFLISYYSIKYEIVMQSLGRLVCAFTGFYLVGWGAMHIETRLGKVFENPAARYVGKISYGVYLFHWILYFLYAKQFSEWFKGFFKGKSTLIYFNTWFFTFIVFVLATIAVASLSYYLIEKPLLRLKSRIS
ncbi:acyltransferase family protein [Flavihumibacter fluvii]|uniref:acyltransferase family protein n=1 Tax=Flavihumibacter fluvii TaxID=2838157 RepID=UPI001BDEA4DD|nr:acyltransferase [Flavihumibacter fluvii]